MTEPVSPAGLPRRRLMRLKAPLIIAMVLVIPALLFAVYVMIALSWSYSEGERAGIVQKFSLKGWLCKTYEGELAMSIVPGVTPTIWYFTVRDEAVANQVNAALGKRAVLHYREHRGIPTTCFGDTNFYVDRVRTVE
jgi:hypothetical protein